MEFSVLQMGSNQWKSNSDSAAAESEERRRAKDRGNVDSDAIRGF